jgi:hypothetical protein
VHQARTVGINLPNVERRQEPESAPASLDADCGGPRSQSLLKPVDAPWLIFLLSISISRPEFLYRAIFESLVNQTSLLVSHDFQFRTSGIYVSLACFFDCIKICFSGRRGTAPWFRMARWADGSQSVPVQAVSILARPR